MAIDFYMEEIKQTELKNKTPFAGYISPNGTLINYNQEYGGETHYSFENPVSMTYLKYISFIITGETKDSKYAQVLKDMNPKVLIELIDKGIDELIFKGYDSYYAGIFKIFSEFYKEIELDLERTEQRIRNQRELPYDRFKLDLLKLFINAYKIGNYKKTMGKITRIDSIESITKKIKEEYPIRSQDQYELSKLLALRVKKEMLSDFKDTCVKYMGYDAVERRQPNGNLVEIPTEEEYDKYFLNTPRVITTSHKDYIERYFNYLLMNWQIYLTPRYIYNEKTGLYEEESSVETFHQKNESLVKELDSIKRSTSIEERPKFFIK